MASRSWLIVPPPARRHARAYAGLDRVVDVGAFDLDVAVPVASGGAAVVAAVARGIEGATVVDEDALARARAERVVARVVGTDGAALVVDGVRVDDVTGLVAVVGHDGPAIVIVRAGGGSVVVARASADLSGLVPGATRDEAFSRFVGGLPQLLGRKVDNLVAAGPALASVVADAVDAVDLVRCATPPPPAPTKAASSAASSPAPSPAPSPASLPDAGEVHAKKCQSCSTVVHAADGYTVFEQPMCGGCAHKYTAGHGQRAAVLSAAFVVATAVFFVLTWQFDVIGRAIGALLVIFVFRTILATGVQYDVDVDSGLGALRKPVRKSGFFKLWGDLDSKWWGKWLLHRGVFVVLGAVAWLVPFGRAVARDDDGAAGIAAAPPHAPSPEIVLRPLSGTAQKDGLTLELVEARVDDGVATVVVDVSKGGQAQQLTLNLDDAARHQVSFGVRWFIVGVAVPPEPPALIVRFDVPDDDDE